MKYQKIYGMKLFVMNRMMAVTRLHTIEWIEFGANYRRDEAEHC